MFKSLGPKTVIYPTPVLIVGTYDKNGTPNAMTVAWGGICSSDPPCVTISVRKGRKTYANIREQEVFTVNIPSRRFVAEADYFGIASGHREDKFTKAGLTPVRSELINAPYIKEFPFFLECRLLHSFEIGVHTQFIGRILDLKVQETLVERDCPSLTAADPILYAPGLQSYYAVGDPLGPAFSLGKKLVGKD